MTQSENPYRQEVFLNELRQQKDRQEQRIWAEHQEMQLSFLKRHGLTSSSTLLDLGCGPMRLGSVVIPLLKDGWYFGQDINQSTMPLVRRCYVIQVFPSMLPIPYLLLINSISAW